MATLSFRKAPVCVLLLILATDVVCQEGGGVLQGIHNLFDYIYSLGSSTSHEPQVLFPGYYEEWGRGMCDNECTCGVPNRMTRIIGGEPTQVNEYPWVVALIANDRIFCGASLISDKHVLTAAHCVDMNIIIFRMTTTVVLAGHYKVSVVGKSSYVEKRNVHSVIKHPKYRPFRTSMDNDIALIVLGSPVQFSPVLAPVCLPSPGEDFANRSGTVVGWGRLGENGTPATELRSADVPILSQSDCYSRTAYKTNLTENMMCAGQLDGGADSCQGDSGGALMVTDHMNRLVTAGIVSWGEGCGRAYRPGVYTRVNRYLEWIQNNTKDGCFCG